ncbi:MAG TPA: hypothetical protein VH143_07635 [Kofleriaceae bacterium]|nr:hypothetical protein [Kofleriaceae bacterium]
MRTWLFVLLAAAACDSPSKLDAISADGIGAGVGDCDPLWDLAPAGTEVGVVASPRGLALALDAFETAAQMVETPDFSSLSPELDVITAALFGAPGASPTDAGIAAGPGFAMFVSNAGVVAIMPVADRDKFVASKHGTRGSGGSAGSADDIDDIRGSTCKLVGGHYVCVSNPALFAQLGTGGLRGKAQLAGGRGDIELYATQLPLFGGSPGDLAVAARLARGEVDVRGTWTGTPGGGLGKLVGLAAPRIASVQSIDAASGFAAGNIGPILAGLPPFPLAGGVTVAQVADSFAGPVSAVVPAGSLDIQVHVPLTDVAPATTALDHCKDMGQLLDLVAVQPKDACRFRLQAAAALELEAWVDATAKELRFGAHRGAPAHGAPDMLTPIGRELAAGDWTAVVWGRGSTFASTGLTPAIVPPPPEAAAAIHAIALVSEVGAGLRVDAKGIAFRGALRTTWSNPPELAKQLAAISGADIATGIAVAPATVDAAMAPDTPFARDFAAGQGGLIIPTGVLGLASAIVIPALEGWLGGDGEPGEPDEDPAQ